MKRGFLAAAAWFLVASTAVAQDAAPVQIVPVPALGGEIAEIARMADQMAEGTVLGGGRWLRIGYVSAVPMVGFVVPMASDTQYNPLDMLRFDLPATGGATVDVDLSASTSWSAAPATYRIMLSSPAFDTPPQVTGVEIVPAGAGDTFAALVAHASQPESFIVSTYHRLRGYRMLGLDPLPVLAGIVLIACVAFMLWKKGAALPWLLGVALAAHFLYGARVDLDLARLTTTHLGEWFGSHRYAEAGSTYALADAVREVDSWEGARLGICFDSTDYFAKLLRYDLLPMNVNMTTDGDPTHVAVVRKIDWSYENGRLRCGSIDAPATLLREFPDGSRLFAL